MMQPYAASGYFKYITWRKSSVADRPVGAGDSSISYFRQKSDRATRIRNPVRRKYDYSEGAELAVADLDAVLSGAS